MSKYIEASGASLGANPDCMIGPSDPCPGYSELYKEANRLREDNERLMAIAQAESEGHSKLRARINDLKEWLKGAEQYYEEKAEHVVPIEEAIFWSSRADACYDFIDDLTKLLEGE